jgi:hypothetical protein
MWLSLDKELHLLCILHYQLKSQGSFMRIFSSALAAAVVVLFSGCAAITTGTTQPLTVTTKQSGINVVGAACELTNGKGTYYITTPGTVTVTRSYSDMVVVCKKDPLPDANMTVKSSVKGMAFGNILVGGLVGVIVDTSTGAAYDYPSSFDLEMGKSVMIGARSEASAGNADAKVTSSVKSSITPTTVITPVTAPAPVIAPVATQAPAPASTVVPALAPAPAKAEVAK